MFGLKSKYRNKATDACQVCEQNILLDELRKYKDKANKILKDIRKIERDCYNLDYFDVYQFMNYISMSHRASLFRMDYSSQDTLSSLKFLTDKMSAKKIERVLEIIELFLSQMRKRNELQSELDVISHEINNIQSKLGIK